MPASAAKGATGRAVPGVSPDKLGGIALDHSGRSCLPTVIINEAYTDLKGLGVGGPSCPRGRLAEEGQRRLEGMAHAEPPSDERKVFAYFFKKQALPYLVLRVVNVSAAQTVSFLEKWLKKLPSTV
jgi:hypothetical protein